MARTGPLDPMAARENRMAARILLLLDLHLGTREVQGRLPVHDTERRSRSGVLQVRDACRPGPLLEKDCGCHRFFTRSSPYGSGGDAVKTPRMSIMVRHQVTRFP